MQLADDDPAGVTRLEAAVKTDDEAAVASEFLIYNFFRQQGRFEEAAQRRWNMRRRADEFDLANRERSTLTSRDEFEAHDLSMEVLQAVRAVVAARSDVSRLYIARKLVKHLPRVAFYVVGCVRRTRWWQFSSKDKDWKTAFELQRELSLPAEFTVAVLNDAGGHNRWLRRRLRALPGAEVWSAT
jgi:hypothetical protein